MKKVFSFLVNFLASKYTLLFLCTLLLILVINKFSEKFVDNNSYILSDLIDLDDRAQIVFTGWYNNHAAAITITNDHGNPSTASEIKVREEVKKRNLKMDYEFVSDRGTVEREKQFYDFIKNQLLPDGFTIFGHGHSHIDHDRLSYEEAYKSFKTNHDAMKTLGVMPVSYAYPKGGGFKESTQNALKEAGFYSGRGHRTSDNAFPHIVTEGRRDPENWFMLPSLVMEDYNFRNNKRAINNANELIPVLEESLKLGSWLILTFHSIGNPQGWGYFDFNEFVLSLEEINQRDFWSVSMDDATRYGYPY